MSSTDCPHGMPTAASCVDCMYDDGLGPNPEPELAIVTWTTAGHQGRAACGHQVELGDPIALAAGIGWICDACGGER